MPDALKTLTSALLITLMSSVTNYVRAENVLYCQAEVATGLSNSSGYWKETNFSFKRFTIKFSDNYSTLEGLTYSPMVCKNPYGKIIPNRVFCVHDQGAHETFQYDKALRRFLFSAVKSTSYVEDRTDTDVMYGGTCQNF